jgi:hypothetical protein
MTVYFNTLECSRIRLHHHQEVDTPAVPIPLLKKSKYIVEAIGPPDTGISLCRVYDLNAVIGVPEV